MLDAVLTYAAVAAAAVFVTWKVLLPMRVRRKLRALASGETAPRDTPDSGCAQGCAGCGVAKNAICKR